jgi:hypothetical protein
VIKQRRMRWAGHVARVVEVTITYRNLVGKLERKRPLGNSKSRLEENSKINKKWNINMRNGFI